VADARKSEQLSHELAQPGCLLGKINHRIAQRLGSVSPQRRVQQATYFAARTRANV
jgi:hypothetical protein